MEFEKYHSKGYFIVYLEETWFNSYDTVCKMWTDNSSLCAVLGQPYRGKEFSFVMLVALRDLSLELFFILEKNIKLHAAYHDNMNGKVFKDWFEIDLLPNLLIERNVVI